ncbi:hypothetical protein [Aurantiacibacter suaedae]|uniref:hypothetical protein n=1 Tax=Aurantiacibacter suaedae TaxID=2545755 RepID=UPI0010F45FDD|nr:hypothetical protein [Aurantiacibacter suaedae]
MQVELEVSPKAVARYLFASLGALVVLGTAADLWLATYPGPVTQEVLHRFSLVRDLSIPSWASSIVMLTCAIALSLTAWSESRTGSPFARGWWIISFAFFALSLDEIVMVHELSGIILQRAAPGVEELGGIFHYSWVLIAIPVVAFFAAIMFRWFLVLGRRTQMQFLLSGAIFLSGAIGLEMAGAALDAATSENGMTYFMLTSIEESLELLGISLFLLAILERFSEKGISLQMSVASAPPRQARHDKQLPRRPLGSPALDDGRV